MSKLDTVFNQCSDRTNKNSLYRYSDMLADHKLLNSSKDTCKYTNTYRST